MQSMLHRKNLQIISISLFLITVAIISVWFAIPILKKETKVTTAPIESLPPEIQGKRVVIYLSTMSLELREDNKVLARYPLLSQGKPGSYYETIGGSYINDYKVPLHFSSIGHVYMPYSVHLFGNYFIHGVPYYPNGTKVSSAYSGGCIRLKDEDAKVVYEFIERGTPIIITREDERSFSTTQKASTTLTSVEMSNLMVATISLEVLTQDNRILDTDGINYTTRRSVLPRLIVEGDTSVARLYARSLGEATFVSLMNQKAEALGLSSTRFKDATSAATTTEEDYERFMAYISTYKSYLWVMQSKAQTLGKPSLFETPTSLAL